MDTTKKPKIALITGASRGIGFEIARQLAQTGVTVILSARTLIDAQHAAAKIGTDVMRVVPLKLDVTQQTDIDAAVAFVTAEFGHLDILINNAGISPERENKKIYTDFETVQKIFNVNTIAPYILTESLIPLLEKSSAGRVVFVSSIRASFGLSSMRKGGSILYSASKSALNMIMLRQARRLEDTNIKVNAAHPGWVRTAMGGEDADLSPQEGAKTAIRLALLPDDGPTGGFFHGDETLPW